jgi:hypothetical protein
MLELNYPFMIRIQNDELTAMLDVLAVESVPLSNRMMERLEKKGFLVDNGKEYSVNAFLLEFISHIKEAVAYAQIEAPELARQKANLGLYFGKSRHLFLLRAKDTDIVELVLSEHNSTPTRAISIMAAKVPGIGICDDRRFPINNYPVEMDRTFRENVDLFRISMQLTKAPDRIGVFAIFPRTNGGVWRVVNNPDGSGDIRQSSLENCINELEKHLDSTAACIMSIK